MKSFRTIVTPAPPPFRITHANTLVSLGSCFSENIGKKFSAYKFNICVNPFGQQYNPHSVANGLLRLINPTPYNETDLVYHNELYHSFDHHGSFSRSSREETLQLINHELQIAATQLRQADILFLTFGAAHVFRWKEGDKIVSNCHKLSGNYFDRYLMSPVEIVEVLQGALARLKELNSKIKIVFTVSPVRYFAFGHYENSVSKAHLFTAIYELQRQNTQFYYFPAYELIMDDLRDYRFFAEDMLHPNYEATNYVWEALCETMMDANTRKLMKEIDEILQAARHKPRNPDSEAHKKFISENLRKIAEMKKNNALNFDMEERLFNQ